MSGYYETTTGAIVNGALVLMVAVGMTNSAVPK
jgi:hypothetical protein